MTLPLPSIEVLAEAASNTNRRGSVLHVLETTVIGWIKQIRVSHPSTLSCNSLPVVGRCLPSIRLGSQLTFV